MDAAMYALSGVARAVPPVDAPVVVLAAQLHALIAVVLDVRVIVTEVAYNHVVAAVVNHAVMFVRCHVKQLLQAACQALMLGIQLQAVKAVVLHAMLK